MRSKNSVILFLYGLAYGTSAPLILSRCSSADCSKCGGVCGLVIGVLPLLLFLAVKGKATRLIGRALSAAQRRKTTMVSTEFDG